jgi:hypothetical protein
MHWCGNLRAPPSPLDGLPDRAWFTLLLLHAENLVTVSFDSDTTNPLGPL